MLVRRGSRMALRRDPSEIVFDRFANAAVIVAEVGQTVEAGHPGWLRDPAGIPFDSMPEPFPERSGDETLRRGGDRSGPPKQTAGEFDLGLHSPI